LEQELHEHFKTKRVNERREMFAVDKATAQMAIEQLGYRYSTAFWADKLKQLNDEKIS
jgi:hypothetical protein